MVGTWWLKDKRGSGRMFFFSSRRRHTRFDCDWSSDVCSSDLMTGQIGQVMQESMQAALTWVRSNAEQLGIPETFFAEHDIHIHVPAGAIPKDGPSAGGTMANAPVLLLTGHPGRPLTALTGEITLIGNLLPIGGVKEKVPPAEPAR